MTAQHAAADTATPAAANANAGDKWYNRFGTLRDVRSGQTRNKAAYVSGEIVADNGVVYPFQTYNIKVINLILSLGDGQKVSLRGPLKPWEFTRQTEAGGSYKEKALMFVPMMNNPPKEKPAPTQDSTAGDGVSETGAAPAGVVAESVDDEIPF